MNQTTNQLAAHVHQVFFGGNWTTVNFKTELEQISWQDAIQKVPNFNSIAALTYHAGYYVSAILNVLQGNGLNSKDELSFDHPKIETEQDWFNLKNKLFEQVELLKTTIELLEDHILSSAFVDEKYGSYHRNFLGLIEHSHYHLGQIVILKKLIK